MSAAFWALRKAPLHALSATELEAFRQAMAGWLGDADPEIRAAALERLCMATFRGADRPGAAAQRAAIGFLLAALDRESVAHPDLVGFFLDQLRWHGDEDPFRAPLLAWLAALTPADAGLAARIEGAMLLVDRGRHSPDDLLALLDHASDHVRACAAHALAEALDPDDFLPLLPRLREREVLRPGILGPFWGAWAPGPEDLPFDAADWMLGVIAERRGPEPAGLPFNGLDFHLHELAGESTAAVARLIGLGEWATALLTATESEDPVPGMAPLLQRLGAHPDPAIAGPAQAQLALAYRVIHAAADPARLRALPGRFATAEAFFLRQGDAAQGRDALVLYPRAEHFEAAEAWALIDAALPPALRGAEAEPPGRGSHGEFHRYAAGPLVILRGDAARQRWQRLVLIGRGLQGRWHPAG